MFGKNTLGFVALLALLCSCAASITAPVPGTSFFASSLYPQYLDVMSFSTDMTGWPCFELTYTQNTTFPGPNGVVYRVPDQFNVVPAASGTCSAFAVASNHSQNFAEHFSASITKTKSELFGLLSTSSSWTVKQALHVQTQTSSASVAAFCNVSTHTIELAPTFTLTPSSTFAAAVKRLLSPTPNFNRSTAVNWHKFFQYWGLAQPSRAHFGGVAGSFFAVDSAYYNAKGSLYTSTEASGALMSFFKASGGTTAGGSSASSAFMAASVNTTVWRGGSCSPSPSGCSFSDWYTTVFAEPSILFLELKPITGFLALVDPHVAAGSTDAIKNYSALGALNNIVVPLLEYFEEQVRPRYTTPIGTDAVHYETIVEQVLIKRYSPDANGRYGCGGLKNKCHLHRQGPLRLPQCATSAIAQAQASITQLLSVISSATSAKYISESDYQSALIQTALYTSYAASWKEYNTNRYCAQMVSGEPQWYCAMTPQSFIAVACDTVLGGGNPVACQAKLSVPAFALSACAGSAMFMWHFHNNTAQLDQGASGAVKLGGCLNMWSWRRHKDYGNGTYSLRYYGTGGFNGLNVSGYECSDCACQPVSHSDADLECGYHLNTPEIKDCTWSLANLFVQRFWAWIF